MKYLLRINALGTFPEISLDKGEFDSIKSARQILSHGLAMEEKYEILISNYLEFEKEILDQAVQSMIRNPCDYNDFFKVRLSFNVRLVNLLTSGRLYIDQLHRHVKATVPEIPDVQKEIKNLFSKEYDKNPEYRFMEALRNYVQHRGIPVHGTQHNASNDYSGEERLLIFTMELCSQKEYLQEDKAFKKTVLKEIPEQVDLKMATRIYVGCLSKVHGEARKLVEQSLKDSRQLIDSYRASYKKVYPKKFSGLHALCMQETTIVDKIPLLIEWDDIRLQMIKRNSELVNLKNRFVTGKVKIS
jgi:hypothetical protein